MQPRPQQPEISNLNPSSGPLRCAAAARRGRRAADFDSKVAGAWGGHLMATAGCGSGLAPKVAARALPGRA